MPQAKEARKAGYQATLIMVTWIINIGRLPSWVSLISCIFLFDVGFMGLLRMKKLPSQMREKMILSIELYLQLDMYTFILMDGQLLMNMHV